MTHKSEINSAPTLSPSQTILNNNARLLGILSACAVVVIWSGWIVSSRWGITTHFAPIDLTWLRFATAAIITLPLSLRYNWKSLPLRKATVVALGCGFPYVLLVYIALRLIPSANASVLTNGFLPIVISLISAIFLGVRITKATLLLLCVILFASFLIASPPGTLTYEYVVGLTLLLLATIVLSIYMIAVKTWNISIREIMVWVPLINTVLLLPFWLVYSNGIGNLLALPTSNLVFHLVYQGLMVSVIALFLFSYAIKTIGAVLTSVFMALVPSVTALLAMIFSSEFPTSIQWIGISLCSAGLIGYCIFNSVKSR